MTVRLAIIAAVAENGIIGRDNDMPWRLSSDLKHFRAVTTGKPVIMGRRTFESIGRALPHRDNIVVTRSADFARDDIRIAASLDEALALADGLARERGVDEMFVIGGGEIYAAAIGRADRLYVTEVGARPEGDAVFPPIDPASWREVAREGPVQGEKDTAPISFVVYERIGN